MNLTGLMRQHLGELANHALPSLSRASERRRMAGRRLYGSAQSACHTTTR
jgi:hypothetical protein